MIVSIHQPEYLPWMGYFDKIARSDIFVILDNVQFQVNGIQNRVRIKNANGWQWLTVPVLRKFSQRINEVKIDNSKKWNKKHWHSILANYSKTPHFKKYYDFFESMYRKEWVRLVELNIFGIKNIMEFLGIKTRIEIASNLDVTGEKNELLINICKVLDADVYISGEGALSYLDIKKFQKEGINVKIRSYNHPIYPQQFEKPDFKKFMSVIDLLFNCGDVSLNMIESGGIIDESFSNSGSSR